METFEELIKERDSEKLAFLYIETTSNQSKILDRIYYYRDVELFDSFVLYIKLNPLHTFDPKIVDTSVDFDSINYLRSYKKHLSEYVKLNLLRYSISNGKIECTKYLLTLFPEDYEFDLISMIERNLYINDILKIDVNIFEIILRDGRF